MKSEVDCKWSNRFLRKYSVEAALQEYNTLVCSTEHFTAVYVTLTIFS